MGTLFDHVPHTEVVDRTGPVKVRGERKSLNDKVGVLITTVVGTMWAAYLFVFLAVVSLPAALASHNTVIIVAWVAQTFLQLVLLPVIIVGQNVQSRAADKRSEQTYNDAEAILHESLEIHRHLEAQDTACLQIQMSLEAQDETLAQMLATLQAIVLAQPKPRATAKKAVTDGS